MLSYRHSFHAGNHADVVKHIVQSLIIESLKEKERPFLYLDTHAGAGRYQLNSAHAQRTGEYLEGIARIWQQAETPDLLMPYLSAVQAYNPDNRLRCYPGSPLIAQYLLRPQDKLQLTELHSSDFQLLRNEFHQEKRVHFEQADGYQQLKAKLPPPSRRALILIDPSYELKTDYSLVIDAIQQGYKRFATGIYGLWYPVIFRQKIKKLCRGLQTTGIRHILQIELAILPDSENRGMTASGMLIINPPWKLEQQMKSLLPWLHARLVPAGTGHTTVSWLVGE